MSDLSSWDAIEAEARDSFAGDGFRLPAYSEFMPPPYVVMKPYDAHRAARLATATASGDDGLDVTEYEQAHELAPGLAKIAAHVLKELDRLVHGKPHELSRTLLAQNPAWPPELAAAAAKHAAPEPLSLALSLALSRTQDDKGNVRWTLFGVSHDGPAAAFWRSFGARDEARFAAVVGFATGRAPSLDRVRVLPDAGGDARALPEFARSIVLGDGAPLDGVETIVTFRPFVELPAPVRQGYLAGSLRLVPHPASLVFFCHPGYRKLGESLARAIQIPLLHLFPHVEGGYGIRIPQSGWLDEQASLEAGTRSDGHRLVHRVARSHRWQKVERDHHVEAAPSYDDSVSVALFSTDADDIGLYGKPMARNAQIWNAGYDLVLDGPRATPLELQRAAATVDRGGRFGYRFIYPAMRAGRREIFWHRPLVARLAASGGDAELFEEAALLGYVHAEAPPELPARAPIALAPRMLRRPGYLEAATVLDRDPGHTRFTTANNVRNLLEFREHVGAPLAPSLARALTHLPKDATIESWVAGLPKRAREATGGQACAACVAETIGGALPSSDALTFAATATRAFEERLWTTIAALAEGDLRTKETADVVLVNEGKSGGKAGKASGSKAAKASSGKAAKSSVDGKAAHAAHDKPAHERDLDRLADHLHDRYRALVEAHGMTGRAQIADQPFHWQTDFPFRWSDGWNRNQSRESHERNVALLIPGRDRRQAVIMADHYDTAYMEDVYEADRGGDGLRAAAAGADDNHSATAALLCAADVLLPLAREGKLARDVWLVHLTGEEFPADCLGARALAQAAVERRLRWAIEDGTIVDGADVRVVGAFVLDMVAHNNDHERDVFQIAPGEGAASARLALHAHVANERWNHHVPAWNQAAERKGRARAARQQDGATIPPAFAHLPLRGEIRPEWDARSALYNTDGQIFSDVGIPVVLFMENYDINRTGYHDTEDTMKNIDLDYAAALVAVAIETVARAASDD